MDLWAFAIVEVITSNYTLTKSLLEKSVRPYVRDGLVKIKIRRQRREIYNAGKVSHAPRRAAMLRCAPQRRLWRF